MRLPPALIEIIAKGVLRTLSSRGTVSSEKPSETAAKIQRLLELDLQRDETISEKAKSLLQSRHGEIESSRDIDYRSLLGRARNELAAKEGFVPWGGAEKISSDKVRQLAREILELLKGDDSVEYFTGAENLKREVALALEKEKARDNERMARATAKVRSIKRNIPEGSSEFVTLAEQFYREFLEKER